MPDTKKKSTAKKSPAGRRGGSKFSLTKPIGPKWPILGKLPPWAYLAIIVAAYLIWKYAFPMDEETATEDGMAGSNSGAYNPPAPSPVGPGGGGNNGGGGGGGGRDDTKPPPGTKPKPKPRPVPKCPPGKRYNVAQARCLPKKDGGGAGGGGGGGTGTCRRGHHKRPDGTCVKNTPGNRGGGNRDSNRDQGPRDCGPNQRWNGTKCAPKGKPGSANPQSGNPDANSGGAYGGGHGRSGSKGGNGGGGGNRNSGNRRSNRGR